MDLSKLGWNDNINFNINNLGEGKFITRVMSKLNNLYLVYFNNDNIQAKLSGRFRYKAIELKDNPAVGDFVVASLIPGENKAIIHKLIPRVTALARKAPISGGRRLVNNKIGGGVTQEQIIAANIDIVFIVSGLDNDFNINRLERYITIAYNSGAKPVIILNKTDKCNDLEAIINQVESIAIGIDILPISALKIDNLDLLNKFLTKGKTILFIGSSGVGKSTITNHLIGKSIIKTQEISVNTNKGKHTTTKADCYIHEKGFIIIDTPGLRELQLWGDEEVLEQSFEDIYELSSKCKFNNCSHETEPGCAIKEAISNGDLSINRFDSFLKQQDELYTLSKKQREYTRNIARINKYKKNNI